MTSTDENDIWKKLQLFVELSAEDPTIMLTITAQEAKEILDDYDVLIEK